MYLQLIVLLVANYRYSGDACDNHLWFSCIENKVCNTSLISHLCKRTLFLSCRALEARSVKKVARADVLVVSNTEKRLKIGSINDLFKMGVSVIGTFFFVVSKGLSC